MEDKITFANVVTLFMNNNILGRPVADELGATDLGDMLSNYRVAKSLRSLRAAYQEYNEQRNKIIEAIGEKDEKGNKRIDPGNEEIMAEFNKQLGELLEIEPEDLKLYPVDVTKIKASAGIKPIVFDVAWFLFKEESE